MSLFFQKKYFKCSKFKRRTELCGSEDQIVWLGGPNCVALHNSVLRATQFGPPVARSMAHGRLALLPSPLPLR